MRTTLCEVWCSAPPFDHRPQFHRSRRAIRALWDLLLKFVSIRSVGPYGFNSDCLIHLWCILVSIAVAYVISGYKVGCRLEVRQNTKNVQNQNLRTEHEKKRFQNQNNQNQNISQKIDKTGWINKLMLLYLFLYVKSATLWINWLPTIIIRELW